MDWVTEHLQIIIGIAAAIAYFLNRKKGEAGDDDAPRTPQPRTQAEADEADRTRRIQEEIRRKIAERRGETAPVPPPVITHAEPPRFERERPLAPVDPFGGPGGRLARRLDEFAGERDRERIEMENAAALARQRHLADELRALENERREAQQQAAEIAARQARLQATAQAKRLADLPVDATAGFPELRSPQALRRAMVLREVLSPPVSLR